MKRRILLISMLLAAVMASNVTAQTNQVLYYMNLPQRNTLNPALQATGRVYVGLPGISDLSFSIDNNFLSFTDIFRNGVVSDSTMTFLEPGEDLDKFVAGLREKNSLEPRAGIQLFGLGFTVGKDLRITFDITERIDGNFVFPKDLIKLGIEGNQGYSGDDIDLSSLRADMKYYHEIGIGASKNITDKLRIGGRLMILGGVVAGYFDNNGLSLKVNNDYTQTINADLAFNVSGPFRFFTHEGIIDSAAFDEKRFDDANSSISYIAGMGNAGLGIDLGAEYRFNEMFAASAALTDLGFIKWKRDRSEIRINRQFELNGLTLQDVYDEDVSFEDLMNWTIDSLKNAMDLTANPEPFTTYLPFGVTAGFSFNPVQFFTAGVLSQTRFSGGKVHESFTLSGNVNFGNTFSGTLAYTVANHRFDNLGFGIAVRGGFAQFYVLVDNIPMKWTSATNGENSFRLPDNWYTVHARIGLNLVFGNRENERPLPPM
jgi:hypothetical protein